MDKTERISVHDLNIPAHYMPHPSSHLGNIRDRFHFEAALDTLGFAGMKTVLDVGCFDGWLDFLLTDRGYQVSGVELIESLANAARAYASLNGYRYKLYQGFFDEVEINESFDAVLCFETLEHITMKMLEVYIEKIERLASHMVIISLPEEDHEKNRQHLWTPTQQLIEDLWSDRRDFRLQYKDYPGTGIPANWFFSYRTD